ncbi:MAG TPA: hypothetical protein VKQ52_05360, partial [Puia sp.]|nr:hypothetical protein [Puia sp.]
MLLFCPHNTPRLRYIVDFCAKELFNAPIRITTDWDEFTAAGDARINYSGHPPINEAVNITPTGLLFATGIDPQPITCFEYKDRKA